MPNLSDTEDMANRASLALLKAEERKVSEALKQSLDDIRVIMSRIYEKYAENGELTKAEMTRYNRMVNLEAQVLEALDPAIKTGTKTMKRVPPEAYGEAFFRYAWAIDASQGVRLRWGTLNMDAIRANLDNSMDKISIERWGPDARLLTRAALNQGLPIGKPFRAMATDIKKALETVNWKALRIIRTEGMTALNAGQNAAYGRAMQEGIEGENVWDATLDGRTRPSHGAREIRNESLVPPTFSELGTVRPQYPADGNLYAAERINCRCRLRFQVSGYAPLLRREREDGIIPYQTYSQWAAGEAGTGPRVRFR
jgi:hypothetical protein